MPLTPPGYRPRIIEKSLALHLGAFGAVEVRGPKWCGKTWLSLSQANSVARLDDASVRGAAELDPGLVLQGDEPHLIDEWQEVPPVWDAVRRAVDEGAGRCGRFLLTGSSTPAMDRVVHSGAGRIARLRMEPMTLFEQGISNGAASISALMRGEDVPAAQSRASLGDVVESLCRGGWPAVQERPAMLAGLVPSQYIEALCDGADEKEGLDASYMRWMLYALARNDGGAASLETIARDTSQGEDPTSADRAAVARYLDYLEKNYLVRNLGGWEAPVKARARTRMRPKRYLVDPSLSAALLGCDADRLLFERQQLGALFESLCLRDLSAYLEASTELRQPSLYYYRDSYGLEVDAVIEVLGGRWGLLRSSWMSPRPMLLRRVSCA